MTRCLEAEAPVREGSVTDVRGSRAEMLSGGFNWIALGWIVDLILEWKPTAMAAIDDEVKSVL